MELRARKTAREAIGKNEQEFDRDQLIAELEKQMYEAADALEFEKAAQLRDKVSQFRQAPMMGDSQARAAAHSKPKPGTPGFKTVHRRKRKSQP